MSAHVCGYVGEWRSESGASGTDYAVHSSFISHFNAGRFGEAVDPRLDDKVKELEHELKQRDIRLQRLKMVRFLAFYFQIFYLQQIVLIHPVLLSVFLQIVPTWTYRGMVQM